MNAIVVGQGSIGQRHKQILEQSGITVFTVSQHLPEGPTNFRDLKSALAAKSISYAVIANKTSQHYETLQELQKLNFSGPVLVEKPLYSQKENFRAPTEQVFVAYILRYHPCVQWLYESLKGQTITSVNAYVGQNLTQWRTNRHYSESYSAKKSEGGGVLRDLSHELDLILWLFGSWKKSTSLIGKFSNLEIETEDTAKVLMSCTKCPSVSLELNYTDHIAQRYMIVNTDQKTFRIDLIKNLATENTQEKRVEYDQDSAMMDMHRDTINKRTHTLCRYEEGLEVVDLIESLETHKDRWITR